MAKEKQIMYKDNDFTIVNVLREHPEGLTLAEIVAATGVEMKAGSITSALSKNLIVRIGDVKTIRPSRRQVNVYSLITDELLTDEKGKTFNYSDSEKAIMAVLKGAEKPMTLAEIAIALNVEKLSSGAINGLVGKKHNVKLVDKVEVIVMAAGTPVGKYAVVAELPQTFLDAEAARI